jgi:hypothetical protein
MKKNSRQSRQPRFEPLVVVVRRSVTRHFTKHVWWEVWRWRGGCGVSVARSLRRMRDAEALAARTARAAGARWLHARDLAAAV